MTRAVAVKLTSAEEDLLLWLVRRHKWQSVSDAFRSLLLTAARHQGAPSQLREAADQSRQDHKPRRRFEDMLGADELQEKVLDLSGKDGGK